MNKKIAILLVITNEGKHIKRLAESINKQSYKAIDVYAIDNNSKDNSVELLRKYLPNVNLIRSKFNNGFAKGNNILAKKAIEDNVDYLFVLNTDMELDKDCIKELVTLSESDKNIGGVAPICLIGKNKRKTNSIQFYADHANFSNGKNSSIYSNRTFKYNTLPKTIEVNTIHGGAMLIKKELYNKIGLFNEDNFMYGDELDFAYRASQIKYKMFVTKRAIAWHFHNWDKSNMKNHYFQYYYIMRSRYLFFHRYNKYHWLLVALIKEILKLPLTVRWALKKYDAKFAYYYYFGLWHGLLNKKGKADVEFK